MAADNASEVSELSGKLDSIQAVLDVDAMRKEADELRVKATDPALWEDQDNAQAVTRRLSFLDAELARLESLGNRLSDLAVMFELLENEDDEASKHEAIKELAAVRALVDELEIRTLMSGEYDSREALVTIR